jgi:hypothetical protein
MALTNEMTLLFCALGFSGCVPPDASFFAFIVRGQWRIVICIANKRAFGCHSEVIFVIGIAVAQGCMSWHLLHGCY